MSIQEMLLIDMRDEFIQVTEGVQTFLSCLQNECIDFNLFIEFFVVLHDVVRH